MYIIRRQGHRAADREEPHLGGFKGSATEGQVKNTRRKLRRLAPGSRKRKKH